MSCRQRIIKELHHHHHHHQRDRSDAIALAKCSAIRFGMALLEEAARVLPEIAKIFMMLNS
jgi:hypothetical protein